jgi:hypothetical protein
MSNELGVRVYIRTYAYVSYYVHFSFWLVDCLNLGRRGGLHGLCKMIFRDKNYRCTAPFRK